MFFVIATDTHRALGPFATLEEAKDAALQDLVIDVWDEDEYDPEEWSWDEFEGVVSLGYERESVAIAGTKEALLAHCAEYDWVVPENMR